MKYCKNCGIYGHNYNECNNPILSYGIILYKIVGKDIKLLMIERKNTIAYTEFMRGRYNIDNINYIKLLFKRFSNREREKIIYQKNFDILWEELWCDLSTINNKIKKEYYTSKSKFSKLDILSIINSIDNLYDEEWEFPKGRRDKSENNIQVAIREFKEETDIEPSDYSLYYNILPIIEEYKSINGVRYKNAYYIGVINDNVNVHLNPLNKHQCNEVNNIKWVDNNDIIRDYNPYKKNVFDSVVKIATLIKNDVISVY